MISELFRLFFGDQTVLTLIISATIFVGVLIISVDILKGRW